MATTSVDQGNMPFIKNLASSDRKTRQSSLSTLRTYLHSASASSQLTPTDHLKLWKGLFYSLWMCDRPVPQQNLCAELAELVTGALPQGRTTTTTTSFSEEGEEEKTELEKARDAYPTIAFLEAFWITMAREWTSIDVLRMEKFLLLVRRVFGAGLAWAVSSSPSSHSSSKNRKTTKKKAAGGRRREEEEEERKEKESALIALLSSLPFDGEGDLKKMPVGIRLHVMDLWVDECEKVGLLSSSKKEADEEEEGEEEEEGLLERIRDLVEGQLKSPSKPVRARAADSLADERLPWNEEEENGGEDGEEEKEGEGGEENGGDWAGFDD